MNNDKDKMNVNDCSIIHFAILPCAEPRGSYTGQLECSSTTGATKSGHVFSLEVWPLVRPFQVLSLNGLGLPDP